MAERQKLVVNSVVIEPASAANRELFISHASADAAVAREVRDLLQELGYATWIAPDDLVGASSWAEQILDAVGRCHALVVLISDGANQSDHVAREVSIAAEAGKPIIPLRLAPVEPGGSLRYLLHLSQWIDVFPSPVNSHADRVRKALVGGGVVRHYVAPRSRSHRWIAMATVVAVVLGAFAWFARRDDDKTTATVDLLADVPTSIDDWSGLDDSLVALAAAEGLADGDDFQLVRSQSADGSVSFEAPSTWMEVEGSVPFSDPSGTALGVSLLVSVESSAFDNGRLGALFVGAGPTTPLMAGGLDSFQPPAYFDRLGCQSSALIEVQGSFGGQARLWSGCDGTPRIYVSALLSDDGMTVFVIGRVTTRDEAAAMDETLMSLEIDGTPLA